MICCYTNDDFHQIKLKIKKNSLLSLVFLLLFLSAETILIVLSTYELRVLFKILSIVIGSFLIIFTYLFFAVNVLSYKKIKRHYSCILNGNELEKEGCIVEVETDSKTQSDFQQVYLVKVETEGNVNIFYFNSIFGQINAKKGDKVKFGIVNKYIKNYEVLK